VGRGGRLQSGRKEEVVVVRKLLMVFVGILNDLLYSMDLFFFLAFLFLTAMKWLRGEICCKRTISGQRTDHAH